jgi:hypothetical protein
MLFFFFFFAESSNFRGAENLGVDMGRRHLLSCRALRLEEAISVVLRRHVTPSPRRCV